MMIEKYKSGIHIKKKNRGKFTSYCGGKVTSACIAKAKASGNPTLVKRATFAANARKWKHQEGGVLHIKDDKYRKYKESLELSFFDKIKRNVNRAKARFTSGPNIGNILGAIGELFYSPQDPNILVGEPAILPGLNGTITRDATAISKFGRYVKEDLIDTSGKLKYPISSFSTVPIINRGQFINSKSSAKDVFKLLTDIIKNPSKGREILSKIRSIESSPQSGVAIRNWPGTFSVDSYPLFIKLLTKNAKGIIPAEENTRTVLNPHGYKHLFKPEKDWEIAKLLQDYFERNTKTVNGVKQFNHNEAELANMSFYKSNDGGIIIEQNSKELGYIPAKNMELVLEETVNKPIRELNLKFNTQYPEGDIKSNLGFFSEPLILWTFRRELWGPSFFDTILYKKGGKL